MSAVFADTSYFIALVSATDAKHAAAKEISRNARFELVVSEYVLVELANMLSRGKSREVFFRLLANIRDDRTTQVVPSSSRLFNAGCELYRARNDKEWSLTDCISFVIMEERSIREVLTLDHHFAQAGFRILIA